MPKPVLLLLSLAVLFVLVVLVGLAFLGWKSRNEPPPHLTERDLRFDNGKPNFVSSLADDSEKRVEPLSWDEDAERAWVKAIASVLETPRTEAIVEDNGYFRAETRSRFFGFVDDVELLLDREGSIIHIRSGSRVGRSDMGKNAERVEQIRQRFEEATEN